MEELYGSIDYNLLCLARINRTVPLYTVIEKDVCPMVNCPIDELIELLKKFYHKINFRNNNLEGWMQHSPHPQFNNKAVLLAKTDYNRFWSETPKENKFGAGNSNDLNQKRSRKNNLKPKNLPEHICIAEFLYLNKNSTETRGQRHRQELPGNYPIFTVVMVIYHYVERIWIILVTPNFLYNIYNHE